MLKSLKIGVFTIFINFGVPLWSKFYLKSFETLHAYQTIYKIPLCKNLRRFSIGCARNNRSKFARANGENFAHSWFRTNSALPRQFNVIIYEFNGNLNDYNVLCSVSDRPICLPKHKEMFLKEKFRNRWNFLLINEDISLYFDFIKYPDIIIKKRWYLTKTHNHG